MNPGDQASPPRKVGNKADPEGGASLQACRVGIRADMSRVPKPRLNRARRPLASETESRPRKS